MHIGRRLFPYPILNNDPLYSQFENSSFQLEYEEIIDEEYYIINDLYVNLNNNYLISLINKKQAQIVCLVECSSTMFRKIYNLDLNKKECIKIPLTEVNGLINVSSYIIATQNIPSYYSKDFSNDYLDYSFNIEKNCILAVDDGYSNKIQFNEREDTKKSSIFLVIKDTTIKDHTMKVEFDTNKIHIYLPEEQWNIYDKTKKIATYQSTYFSILIVPALLDSILSLQKTGENVEELRIDYLWFDSFATIYEKNYDKELTNEIFSELNALYEIQKIFNGPNVDAINMIFDSVIGQFGGISDED